MHGERRLVSILFCDVTGSTEMAKDLDPEDWAELMHEAFEYLIAPVYRYEGTLARMMGDGIMAFFGAPLAHEDDAERAVLAGLAILKEIGPFSAQVQADYGLEFNVRVGVNTGHVVVGDIGSDLAMEYTAMGDTVNMAARMEATAEPGTVQVSQETYKLIAPLFEVEALEGVEIKGRKEPVQTYRIVAPKAEPGSVRGIKGLSSPLVGRSREFERLQGILQELQQGRGGIAFLIGEAGLGKTRLIEELQKDWLEDGRPQRSWIRSRAISYDANQPYGLLRDHLRSTCSIAPDDTPQEAREKIRALVQSLPEDIQDRSQESIELLLSIQREEDVSHSQGESLKRELFSALHDALRGTFSEPTVLVFDDLHWSDAASSELMRHYLQLTEQVPVLFLFAMRPYRKSPGWQIKVEAETSYPHRYSEIELQPLSSAESEVLVANLLQISELPTGLQRRILEKAEGNPFFVEELIRTLIESGVVVRDESGSRWRATAEIEDISLPGTVQGLLISRIDRLDSEIRQTVQLASVIGRRFYYRVLEWIAEATDALQDQLNTLQRVEIIRERARIPELEYMFRHDLTRDAAYQTILRRKRPKFHLRVGEAIEALFPERLEEEAHLLAYHYREAKEDEKALKYYTLAGNAARRLSAYTEAIDHYSHALEIANRVEASPAKLSFLYTRRGRIYELASQYDDALKNYHELETLGKERSEPALEMAALNSLATIYAIPSANWDPEQADVFAQRALTLAEQLEDPRGEAKALWNLMLVEVYAERDHQAAIDYGERSLAIAREHDLIEEKAFALNDLARAYGQAARIDNARELLEEARGLWEQLGNSEMLADNLTSASFNSALLGELDHAVDLAERALDLSRKNGNFWGQGYSLMGLGMLRSELGEIEAAIEAYEEGASLAERAEFTGAGIFVHALVAWLLASFGALDRASEIVERTRPTRDERDSTLGFMLGVEALILALGGDLTRSEDLAQRALNSVNAESRDPEFLGYATLMLAELMLLQQEFRAALDDLDRSLNIFRESNIRFFAPQFLLRRAMALRGLERSDEAAESLEQARDEAESMGMQLTLMWILIEMVELADDQEQAQAPLSDAQESIRFIAERLGDDDLRQTFLSQPRIRSVMGA